MKPLLVVDGDSLAHRAGVRPGLALLHEPLLPTRTLGKDHHHLALARELNRGRDRFGVALSTANAKRAGRLDDRPERKPVQLRLGHEAELSAGEKRQSQGPRIEVREVVRREDKAAFAWNVFLPAGPETKDQPHRRPGDDSCQEVER